MTNQLDAIVPKILARGMLSFRETSFMPRIVNANMSAESAQKGDSIDVMIPGNIAVEDVVPGIAPPDAPDTTANVKTIPLNRWKKVSFYLSDKDMMQIDADQHFIPFQMQEAVTALANEVNKSFFEQSKFALNVIGVPGKKLFSNAAADANKDYGHINPALLARKMLTQNKAPKSGRYAVLGYEEEANAIALAQFADAEKTGDSSVRLDGEIGRKYGINWFSSDSIDRYKAKATDTFTSIPPIAAGDTTAILSGVEHALAPGTIIVDDRDRVITSLGKIIEKIKDKNKDYKHELIIPALHTTVAATVLKMGFTYNDNMAFHRDAFAFAMRPLAAATENIGLGNRILSVTDPETGLSMRLEISRQYKRTLWEFDILWGVEMVRPELAVRLIA